MARTSNPELHQARAEQILTAAREHLAESGIAGFSLRAVARRLDLAPNSLYNYYPSLDELITALLIDAFGQLAAAVAAADQGDTWAARFTTVCLAYRAWAVANPTDYDLIFGRPIPNYHAPAARTGALATQAFERGLHVMQGAWRAGALSIPTRYQAVPPQVATALSHMASSDPPGMPLTLRYLMFAAWARLHGMVILEIHGHDDASLGDPAAFFAHNVHCLIDELGFHRE